MREKQPPPTLPRQPNEAVRAVGSEPNRDRARSGAEAIDRWVNEGGALPATDVFQFLPPHRDVSSVA
jgi:hypothetical protein